MKTHWPDHVWGIWKVTSGEDDPDNCYVSETILGYLEGYWRDVYAFGVSMEGFIGAFGRGSFAAIEITPVQKNYAEHRDALETAYIAVSAEMRALEVKASSLKKQLGKK